MPDCWTINVQQWLDRRMSSVGRCWCGSENLAPFNRQYLSCRDCETLIAAGPEEQGSGWAERGYGRSYWFQHQEEHQRPNLAERCSSDLSQRCPHWLRTVLRYKLPPGRTLELGCGHGAFVALLAWAGFEAMGLEMDPWVVDFARQSFDVPVLRGPLEEQDLGPGSLDLIVAMDVLEHLPDPAATLVRCFELLRQDGVLVAQTPCRPSGKSLEQLSTEGHRFLEMLLPDEHLFLFSETGVRALLRRQAAEISFEPALFDHYDMFFVASRWPLCPRTPAEVSAALGATPKGRAVSALLDLHAEREGRDAAVARTEELQGHCAAQEDRQQDLERQNRELIATAAAVQEQQQELERQNRELKAIAAELEAQASRHRERRAALEQRLRELETQDPIHRLLAVAPCESGDAILPTSKNVLFEGWSIPEGGGQWRWSDGRRSRVLFRAGGTIAEAKRLLLQIEAGTHEPQVVEVRVNGISVGKLRSERDWEPSTYELFVPSQAIEAARQSLVGARIFEIEVEIPGAVLVGDGPTQRRIGLCLRRLKLRVS